jgi:glucose/arabinose dehydrogenase
MVSFRWLRVSGVFVIIAALLASAHASANTNITWPASISLNLVESSLTRPVQVTHAGDRTNRLFVVEQDGRVKVLVNGDALGTAFLDIKGRVRSPEDGAGRDEEGLLSIAFPPGYGSGKDYFYVYYTNLNGDNQVSRFHLGGNANQADSASEELILPLPHPGQTNHNGGQLFFGPDSYLYIGTGDGGGGGDPAENAQNPAQRLGKMLRIDVEPDGPVSPGLDHRIFLPFLTGGQAQPLPYTIPPDNPFINNPGYLPEIWALGLRNPWRYSFDRTTGDLYIGDVGQGNWEEVDFQSASSPGGENYGWDNMEGFACFEPSSGCTTTGMTLPIRAYANSGSSACAVTGGYVYRGPAFPSLQGIYIYADYCIGTIWGLQRDTGSWVNQQLTDTPYLISSFGEDEAGELYLTDLNGALYQIVTP